MGTEHYLLWKSLHILGVVLFLGNIIVTGVWKGFADSTRDWKIIVFSQRLVTYTDLIFTLTGVVLILITGTRMALLYGDFGNVKWIAWGLGLFIASGVIWVTILVPVQLILHRMANQFQNESQIPQGYWFYERIWILFGITATVLPLMNLYWMVFKPT